MSYPIALSFPLNALSFGSTSIALLREMHKRGLMPCLFPIGNVDLSTQKPDAAFQQWLQNCINTAPQRFSRKGTSIKLWHVNGSHENVSSVDSRLITFQESGQLTPTETNLLRQQDRVYVTNRYAQSFFSTYGVKAEYMPLGFDLHNFGALPVRPKIEGVTSWGIFGKLEARKHSLRQLALWAKKYGNNKDHRLNLAINNSFLRKEDQEALIARALEGKQYWNINPLPFSPTNAEYNAVLQSSDIVLCCSGSEGFGLPEFHATALGAWPVALRAHAYTDFFTDENAILVNPNGMVPIYDGMFFHPNQPFNQGNIFSFNDEDWYAACSRAETKVKTVGLNRAGMELQKWSYVTAVDVLVKDVIA